MRLNKTDLARRAGLGRTSVSGAFQTDRPVPSAQTVAALARALQLPFDEMMELQRKAARRTRAGSARGDEAGPGRPIEDWEPLALEVHPAAPATDSSPGPARRALPAYVLREHDRLLAQAVRAAGNGRSQLVVLVGSSSTGKTRACWEAVQPLARMGWKLWHPFDPTRAEAALEDLHRVVPWTVVWLNEAQHYLGDPAAGERIAAAVHTLLTRPDRGPVLVLGTLWPEYARQYTALPAPGGLDPHSRVRELLGGHTIVTVPDTFNAQALNAAAELAAAGDQLLADALTRTRTTGRMAQELAGAPQLLDSYEHGSPAARALLEAAMDARRLGVGLHLPQTFLIDAATSYFSEPDYDQRTDDWAEAAFAELARPVHGKQAPLRRAVARPTLRPPGRPYPEAARAQPEGTVFRLADYLEQHGRATRRPLCPPASFWHAAHSHLTHPDDLYNLAQQAWKRHRLQWEHHLCSRAAAAGHTHALARLARSRERAGDREGAEALLQQAASAGSNDALVHMARMREKAGDCKGAQALLQEAADAGHKDALVDLARILEQTGDHKSAEALYRRTLAAGSTYAVISGAKTRESNDNPEGAEALYQLASDAGHHDALVELARLREQARDSKSAEAQLQQAAEAGSTRALLLLAEMRERAGDPTGTEALLQRAVDALLQLAGQARLPAADPGYINTLFRMAHMRERAGDREGAEALLQPAADAGNRDALFLMADMRERAENHEGAEALLQPTADAGDTHALCRMAKLRERAGDRHGAEALLQPAADAGDIDALFLMSELRERAGDRHGAETVLQLAVGTGHITALFRMAEVREQGGDHQGAEELLRQAVDAGLMPEMTKFFPSWTERAEKASRLLNSAATSWRYGLDPDGTPTPPWQEYA